MILKKNLGRWTRLGTGLLLASCVLVYIAMFTFINVWDLDKFCNPDVLADMQVAKRMWEQKTLFPEGWIFGNQLYVIATPVLAAIFYGMTDSIYTAMILATAVMTLLILVSFVWMLRVFTRDYLMELTACLLLIISVVVPEGTYYSLNLMLFFLQASFYACYLITMFVVLGDYARTYQTSDCRLMAWIISLLLCFATGMQSLRQMVIMILPIFACEMLQIFRNTIRKRSIHNAINLRSMIRVLSYGMANVAGMIAVSVMDIAQNTIYGEMIFISPNQMKSRIMAVGVEICELLKLNTVLTGSAGIAVTIAVFLSIGCVVMAFCVWFARIHRPENGLELCWLVCLIGIIGVMLSSVLLNITLRSIYMFLWFPLVALSAIMLLQRVPEQTALGVMIVCCCLSACIFYESYSSYVRFIVFDQEKMVYTEEEFQKDMCYWAIDNGIEYVYGDYWATAPKIVSYSDGKLEAGCWHTPENIFNAEPFNTPQDIYGEEENKKAIYVFTPSDEAVGLQVAQERGAKMEKVAEFGDNFAYISSIPLMQPYQQP